MFYLKLALQNIRNSIRVFAPFVLASLVLFTIISSMFGLMFSPVMTSMGSGAVILGLGLFVLTIFSLIMEIYSYNFLMQQRSREFGLYNMLGMNKKKVALIASIELILLFLAILLLGSVLGIVFSNVLYLIFVNLVGYSELHFSVDPLAFVYSAFLFGGIFLVLEFLAIRKIGKTNPLILFRSSEKGEKEPKGNILLAALGILSLGTGYYLSLSSKETGVGIIYLFFLAVLLVIAGTYLFYISFMTWLLKRRRKNKRYFYQPEHFITTSQMIFRMKQHATGLANITLLAVMSFVTIATTTSLYTGMQGITDNLYPREASLNLIVESREEAKEAYQQTVLANFPDSARNVEDLLFFQTSIIYDGGEEIAITEGSIANSSISNPYYTYVITQDDFRKLGNELSNLDSNQVAVIQTSQEQNLKRVKLEEQVFETIAGPLEPKFPGLSNTLNGMVLVVPNDEVLNTFKDFYKLPLTYRVFADISKAEIDAVAEKAGDVALVQDESGKWTAEVFHIQDFSNMLLGFTGGFLFTGFLLGISFLLGAALIIYYKQYSEGHEDKKSYKILQEVGMSQTAVKKTINSQVLLVFFMPLGMATLHFIASLVMLKQMLALFEVNSSSLIYTVSAVTLLSIGILYYVIYKLTSRTYYRIIER
ncbi:MULTISPECIES: ABC transporter permease [unclassified Streptococcus]|uniref:ABC transporter permease n=1 Tax=unclassified Streptococcus TaxID=2608887 RepID=UPI001072D864|nr:MULTISPECIES: ABC transporter permease [unclassified Streptococcus]MBF0805220.1 ABC transporter permease [Streptococcus sp. 19428wA2_WM07]TFU29258.1 ABC transporter permease [Streptococcus sp. WM07]